MPWPWCSAASLGEKALPVSAPNGDALKVALAACGMGIALWQAHDFTGPAALAAQVLGGALVYGTAGGSCWTSAGLRARLMAGLGRMAPGKLTAGPDEPADADLLLRREPEVAPIGRLRSCRSPAAAR